MAKVSRIGLRKSLAERTGSLVTVACLSTIAGLTYLALLVQIPIRLIVLSLVGACALACTVGVVVGFRVRRKVDQAMRTLTSHAEAVLRGDCLLLAAWQ